MRSTSAQSDNAACISRNLFCKIALACNRCFTASRSRKGCVSQSCNNRAPMLVALALSSENNVGEAAPLMVSVISRLRRVAASMRTKSSPRSTDSPVRCGNALRCVCCTYCSSAPAAAIASGISAQPNPARSAVLNWRDSSLVADAVSNCQSAMRRTAMPLNGSIAEVALSDRISSAGCKRSSSARNCEAPVSRMRNFPAASERVAIPSSAPRTNAAAIKTSRAFGSSALSVSVPGVITRTTARSTGPLLVTSPICSQIAADSPAFTSFARYDSIA